MIVGQGDEAILRRATVEAAAGDSRVRYLHLERRGASIARNAGAGATAGEIVVFIDDDCEAEADLLDRIDEAFGPDIGLVCGSVLAPPDLKGGFAVCPTIIPESVTYDPAVTHEERPAGFGLLGANLAVRRTAAERVTFDEYLGPGTRFDGGEDHDYIYRLSQAGVKMRSTPAAIVHHTYGVRYGLRVVYQHRRDRLRGDGALAAKLQLMNAPNGGLSIRACVRTELLKQVTTLSVARLPYGLLRLCHYTLAFRECLRSYVCCTSDERARVVLVPRTGTGRRSVTGEAAPCVDA